MPGIENPTVRATLTPEQARAIREAPTGSEELQGNLEALGIGKETARGDVAIVTDDEGQPTHYALLDWEDAGTRLTKRTADELGLPPLGANTDDADDSDRAPIVTSKPGDPGHEQRVADWNDKQRLQRAMADSVASEKPRRL